jgi:3-carboxy-cis,cis-muconate cycloisomerase
LLNESPMTGRATESNIRALFSDEARWQAWLDIEAALALTQAELGMIPVESAQRIAEVARLDLLDPARLAEAAERTSHPLVPLVWELSRVAGERDGGWVHWGATTQNIVQTGDIVLLRATHLALLRWLATILEELAALCERSATMVIAGRTHGQHAVPTTMGFKVAVWTDELVRHVERMQAVEPRVFMAMLGGAVGNYASLGEQGPEVQAGVARRLGLAQMSVPARSVGDHLAEYVCLLGLLAATVGKMAREIYTLMKTEFQEVEEPVVKGTVGSSTMPHKRNPKLCQAIIADSATPRAMVAVALEAMQIEHEADRSHYLMMQRALESAAVSTGDMLSRMAKVLNGLQLFPDRMRRNVELSNGLMMSEAVMLHIGRTAGRQAAHDIVYDAAQRAATESIPVATLLAADPRAAEHITGDLAELLDPDSYIGLSAQLAQQGAETGRRVASELTDHSDTLSRIASGRLA